MYNNIGGANFNTMINLGESFSGLLDKFRRFRINVSQYLTPLVYVEYVSKQLILLNEKRVNKFFDICLIYTVAMFLLNFLFFKTRNPLSFLCSLCYIFVLKFFIKYRRRVGRRNMDEVQVTPIQTTTREHNNVPTPQLLEELLQEDQQNI